MREETRSARQEQIERAAYEVLEEKGFAGASMLAIARKARASNETLYNWYGDKIGLFRALVIRNAEDVKELLLKYLKEEPDALKTLSIIGPHLLNLLTSPRAIALNRAAAADPSGELGAAIAEAGRDTILPMICEVLERSRDRGQLGFSHTAEAADLFIALLVGDLQIRRAIGRIPALTFEACEQRSELACTRLRVLLPAG